MKNKPNHVCRMCGTAYYACSQCDKQYNWRAFCDTPEHYQVFQVLLMHARGIVGTAEARDMLIALGVSPDKMPGFLPQKVDEIRAIFAAAEPVVVEPEPKATEFCETDAPRMKHKHRRPNA